MGDLSFQRIGEKIKILEHMGLRDKETGKRWRIKSEGIRVEISEDSLIGPCDQTIRNWIAGGSGASYLVKEMCDVLNQYAVLPSEMRPDDFSDTVSETEFMRVLGVPRKDELRAEAAMWAARHLPGDRFILNRSYPISNYEEAYCGCYDGVRWLAENGKRAARSSLRLVIDDAAPISPRKTERSSYLPCRLAVESSDGKTWYRYRGAFSVEFPTLIYVFHQEDAADADMIVVMTDRGDTRERPKTSGHLVTATPGPNHVSVSYGVEFKWRRHIESPNDGDVFLNGGRQSRNGK